MTIYTKGGDKGETGLPGKRRLLKKEQLFEVLGNLDQTNASIGVAISSIKDDNHLVELLEQVQRLLLEIGATLASQQPQESGALKELEKVTLDMESQIDAWDKQIPELKNFILPGGNKGGAQLHFCRTLVRQTERSYHRLNGGLTIQEISIYLNRLSDFFFQAARYYNVSHNEPEQIWQQLKH